MNENSIENFETLTSILWKLSKIIIKNEARSSGPEVGGKTIEKLPDVSPQKVVKIQWNDQKTKKREIFPIQSYYFVVDFDVL